MYFPMLSNYFDVYTQKCHECGQTVHGNCLSTTSTISWGAVSSREEMTAYEKLYPRMSGFVEHYQKTRFGGNK